MSNRTRAHKLTAGTIFIKAAVDAEELTHWPQEMGLGPITPGLEQKDVRPIVFSLKIRPQ